MPDVVLGHFSGTLGILAQKGVRYSTVIDLGCADGFFYLQHFDMGLLPGSIVVNVDANAMYEPSLREIRQVLEGTTPLPPFPTPMAKSSYAREAIRIGRLCCRPIIHIGQTHTTDLAQQ